MEGHRCWKRRRLITWDEELQRLSRQAKQTLEMSCMSALTRALNAMEKARPDDVESPLMAKCSTRH